MANPNKNIALKPFIYDQLVALKRGNDDFSDVVERLLKDHYDLNKIIKKGIADDS